MYRGLGICISAAAVVGLLTGIAAAEENSGVVPEESSGVPAINQVISSTQPDRINSDYAKGYFTDTGRMLESPASWDRGDWLRAGLVIGATAGLYFTDADIRDFARKNQSSTGDKVSAVGNFLGNPFYAVPQLGLFYLYGHLNDDPRARRASLLAMESLVISGIFTGAVKFAAQRPRPSTGETATSWNGPSLKERDPSFPSNHTTAAFSIASVLAGEYRDNAYVPPIAYGLATLVGFSRVYDDKHWASDAFFGAAIGYVVGKAVVRYHTQQGEAPLSFFPTASRQGFGVSAVYRF